MKSNPRYTGLLDPSSREAFFKSWIRADTTVTRLAITKPFVIGGLYASLGDKDQAFEWLEKAYREQDSMLGNFVHGCAFDNLRSDPRYADLMHRLGLLQ